MPPAARACTWNEAADGFGDLDLVRTAVRSVAPTLHLSSTDIDKLVTEARMERYGAGETMQIAESVHDSMRLILAGGATLTVELKNGTVFTVGTLSQGDYIGHTALTRERVAAGVVAIDEVTVLRVPVASLDRLVHRKPELSRDIGKAIDQQRLRATPERWPTSSCRRRAERRFALLLFWFSIILSLDTCMMACCHRAGGWGYAQNPDWVGSCRDAPSSRLRFHISEKVWSWL